ncbi:biosynthetic peptidoglycan transglycosylase [Hymenobacter sp. GOD-10R]|uniref:biosynthetic peptidoglycan transglycosylase n=1 Tax=Hymenobacter sp. GOD-10R TaxID=3093922 RepID=UPI002D79D709|nr:biosynthetic peptidoglycan transglycosylase [Hymenobacter sp. GOD-10R]WRQ30012.1 biosynthetic peptidoglycan transglycosylase [Hymenobacter sp. GOD-10R]
MDSAVKKKIGIGLGLVVVLLGLALAAFLLKRQQLLDYALAQVKTKVERKYPAQLTLGPARFTDLNSVRIEGVALVPAGRDTLLRASSIDASLSVRSLFAGRPVFSNLQIDNARLTARKTAAADNYSFLYRKKKTQQVAPRDTTKGTNYGLLLNELLEAGFDNIPGEAAFKNFLVTYESPRHQARIVMPGLTIEDGDITGQLSATIDSVSNNLGISGHVEAGDYELAAQVYGLNSQPVTLPYLQRRLNARVQFDTLRMSLDGKDFDEEQLTLRGSASATHFVLNQPKLAARDIVVQHGGINFITKLGQASMALEKGTKVRLNRIEFYPTFSIRKLPVPQRVIGRKINGVRKRSDALAGLQVSADIESAETSANDFFASLPEGMFEEVEGMQGEGTLTYSLHTALDMNQVDSLKFDSSLRGKNFRITKFGRENLNKLNEEFPYTAYNDKGDSIKTFLVGPSNKDFVPYDEVSRYLKSAIQTAEDPRFFTHKGFMEKAFVKSAIQNLKERRFARGGSTISMQLVKNVFLTRQKTVARKVEEMLMVWLIENTRLVSKERMFEVYLNIIEWGPKIYGVKDAARFYFDKQPANLNLSESLYLASIIPKPKFYRYSFDSYGNLRGSARYFYRLIADIMVERGMITQADRENMALGVALNGPARKYIVTARDTTRTAAADSSQFEPLNLIDLLGGNAAPDAGVNSNTPETQPASPPPRP